MIQRRKSERRHLAYYLKVYDRLTGKLVGRMGNMTGEGLMLLSPDELEVGKAYALRVEFPEKVEGQTYLDIDVRSLWSDKDVLPNYYNTGCQLLESSLQYRELIQQVIEEFGVRA